MGSCNLWPQLYILFDRAHAPLSPSYPNLIIMLAQYVQIDCEITAG